MTETRSSLPGLSPVDSRLYLIVDARPDLVQLLEAAISGGVDIVQIRDKERPDAELFDALVRAREVTARFGVPLVVNDRPDLAVLVEADYVHVGQDDLPVVAARRFGLSVGLSTHSSDQIGRADADYLGVGPVYATPTKPGGTPVGLELVRHAARAALQPWFALGGIDAGNAAEVVASGAERLAVIRAIADAPDPERAARELRAMLPPS